ncbi:MAG: hypothetical protein GY765_09195 [bacterium]|nr:hypothetical protein [bacterium]
MVENTINGKGKALYYFKAGIGIGTEEYLVAPLDNGYAIRSHTRISDMGTETKQNVRIVLDNDFNTLNLDVHQESKEGVEKYTFDYADSEARVKIEQVDTTSGKDRNVDQTLVWDNLVPVLPAVNSANLFRLMAKKYDHEKKGCQDIACTLVPKMVFSMEYLGEDILEVKDEEISCKRYKIKYNRSGAAVNLSKAGVALNMWVDEEKDVFRILVPEAMVSIQSYKNN